MQARMVQITVIDDVFVERDENLISAMTLTAIDDPVIFSPAEASILIGNDDGMK